MVPVGLRADSFLAGYAIDISDQFVLNDAQVDSYMGATDVIAFAIALSGTGMANKIPSTLYMINIEQDNPLAVQAVTDDGPLALSVMETLRYCDEDGCHAMTVAVDAVATASADDAAAAAVSVSFTRNSLIKKDGSPPAALNVAATATEFVAQATDSDGNTGVAFASTTEACMVAFAPAAFLVFCEDDGTKAKGFDPEDRKFPMAMTFYDGKQVVCTSAAADGCTDESGNVTWTTDSGCAKKKTGKAGVSESDWEPCGATSLDECCNSGVSWVRSKTTGSDE